MSPTVIQHGSMLLCYTVIILW